MHIKKLILALLKNSMQLEKDHLLSPLVDDLRMDVLSLLSVYLKLPMVADIIPDIMVPELRLSHHTVQQSTTEHMVVHLMLLGTKIIKIMEIIDITKSQIEPVLLFKAMKMSITKFMSTMNIIRNEL